MVDCVLELNLDLVITEKGISGASFRLIRVLIADCSPTLNRLCAVLLRRGERLCAYASQTINPSRERAASATIVNRVEDLRESDVGARCRLFSVESTDDE